MNVMPFLPWSVLAIERLADRQSLARIIFAAMAFALQFLGAHAASSVQLVVVSLLVCCVGGIHRRSVRPLIVLLVVLLSLLMGLAIAAVQWLPMIDNARQSIGYGVAQARGMRLGTLAGMVFPYVGGNPSGWIGSLGLALALLGLIGGWRTAWRRDWAIVGGLTILAMELAEHWIRRIPGVTDTNSAGWMAGTALAMALLAGGGMEDLTLRLSRRTKVLHAWVRMADKAGIIFLAVLAVAELLAFALRYNCGGTTVGLFPPTAVTDFFQGHRDAPACATQPVRIATLGAILPPGTATAWRIAEVGMGRSGSGRLAAYLSRLCPQALAGSLSPAVGAALRLLGVRYLVANETGEVPGGGWQRVFPTTGPSASAEMEGMAVYENSSVLPRAWVARRAELASPATSVEVLRRLESEFSSTPGKFDPTVKVLVDLEVSGAAMEWLTQSGQDGSITPEQYLAKSGTGNAGALVTFLEDSPNRLRLHIEKARGGWLALSDAYAEGWQASVSAGGYGYSPPRKVGRPIVPACGVGRAVSIRAGDIGAGPMEVTMEYRPRMFKYGAMASAGGVITVLLMLGCCLVNGPAPAIPGGSGVFNKDGQI